MTGDMVVKCFGLVERGVSPMRHICRRACIALRYRSTYGKTRDLSLTVSRYSGWSLGLCISYFMYVTPYSLEELTIDRHNSCRRVVEVTNTFPPCVNDSRIASPQKHWVQHQSSGRRHQ